MSNFSNAQDQITTAMLLLVEAHANLLEELASAEAKRFNLYEQSVKRQIFKIEAALSFLNPDEKEKRKAEKEYKFKHPTPMNGTIE
jgi:hypothetical protein